MKKVIIILLFVPLFSFGQSFGDGYKEGWKAGYCHDKAFCTTPIAPIPSLGKQSYQDGYSSGFAKGTAKYNQEKSKTSNSTSNIATYPMPAGSGNTISSSYGTLSTSTAKSNGAYTNPGSLDKRVEIMKQQQESLNKMNQQISNAAGSLMAKGMRVLAEERKSEGIFYLGKGQYKIVKVGANGFVSLKKLGRKCDADIISIANKYNLDYKLSDTKKRKAGIMIFPKIENTYTLFKKDGELALNEEIGIIEKPVVEVQKSIISKDEAVKRLKDAKDLFDSGILTKEEYDKLVAKYKPIIMGN